MSRKIVHLMLRSQFSRGFIIFVNDHFNPHNHIFILIGGSNLMDDETFYEETKNVIRPNIFYRKAKNKRLRTYLAQVQKVFLLFRILPQLLLAKKIILHSWYVPFLDLFLMNFSFLLKKSYWCIWGGDLYDAHLIPPTTPQAQKFEQEKIFMIKKLYAVITYMKGDYMYAKEWYGFNGIRYSSFMYKSNLYKDLNLKQSNNPNVTIIQIGNSATDTNHHLEIFDLLKSLDLTNVQLMAPLSYGDDAYRNLVIERGQALFNDKFIPMTTFTPLDEYNQFQSTIDIAIFNHNRQQGVGNITTLLGMGKKVYLRSDVSTYQMFIDLGVTIFDIKKGISLEKLDPQLSQKNIEIIKKYFSEEQLEKDLANIWDH